MKLQLYFVILTGVSCVNNNSFGLIISFLKNSNYKFCYFLTCWTNSDTLKMHKIISHENMNYRTAFLSVKNTNISDINDGHNEKISYILDLTCENTVQILKEISYNNKFRLLRSWLMIGDSKINEATIIKILENVQFRLDSDINIAIPKSESDEYDIFEIYDPGLEVDNHFKQIGIFINKTLLYYNKNVSFYESRKNMSKVLIRSGNVNNYSMETYKNDLRNKGISTFAKFQFQLFRSLVQIHKFHYNTTLRSAWFGNSSSGLESGLSQLLYENKIDISSVGGVLRYGRMEYYDYLLPYYNFRTSFFFRNPGTVKPGAQVLKPFTMRTWYATVVAIFVISLTIKIAYNTERRYFRIIEHSSLYTCFVITISAIAQQGSALFPHHIGGRLMFLNLLFFSIMLYNYYTSSLVSSLLSTKPPVLSTIKELYESNLRVGVEDKPYTTTYIVQQKNNYYIQKLNSTKIYQPGPNYYLPEEGLAKVKKGGFAYHTDVTTAYAIIARLFEQEPICDLTSIEFLPPGVIGLMTSKKSQYSELFRISLVKMRERGIHKREHNIWIPQKPECLSDLRVESVGTNELFVIYLILILGMFLASVVYLIEVIWFRTHNAKNISFLK